MINYISTIDISIADIQNKSYADFSIFPNPFNDNLFISSNSKINYEVILTDLTGKVLMIKEITGSDSIINTNDLISGNYLLIIKSIDSVKTFNVCK